MIRLEMKNYNMILTEKQQKYHHYHPEKLIKMSFLQCEEILPPNQRRVIEPAKFPYSPLGKAFEKETKIIEEQGKKIEALKALTEEEGRFPK